MTENEEAKTFSDELAVTSNTVDFLEQLGSVPEIDPVDAQKTAGLLKQAVAKQDASKINTPPVAFAAREFLRVYSSRLAAEMSDVRSAITNKLMELANCGDPRFELKALELLGKHSDIALFTERSEVTVNYKTSGDLEEAIKERIKRLLNANTVDMGEITPSPESLDEELGKYTPPPKELDIDEIPQDSQKDAS